MDLWPSAPRHLFLSLLCMPTLASVPACIWMAHWPHLSTWAAHAHGQVVFYDNMLHEGLRVNGMRAAVTIRGSLGSSREADTLRQGVGQRFHSGTGHCCCFLSRPRDMEKAAHAFGQMPDGLLGQFGLGRAWFPSEGVKTKWYQRGPH